MRRRISIRPRASQVNQDLNGQTVEIVPSSPRQIKYKGNFKKPDLEVLIPSTSSSTEIRKRMGPRLRELTPATGGGRGIIT